MSAPRRWMVFLTDAERDAAIEALTAKLAGEVDQRSGDLSRASYDRAADKLAAAVPDGFRLLYDARNALAAEQHSYGVDEVRQNPILQGHLRIKVRLDRTLEKIK